MYQSINQYDGDIYISDQNNPGVCILDGVSGTVKNIINLPYFCINFKIFIK